MRTARRRLSPLREVMSGADYRKVAATPAFQPGATRLFGLDVAFSDAPGLLHSVREIFYDEVYRFQARSPDPLIIDVGANIGLSVLYFKRLYPDALIVAFEPDPAIFRLLQRNMAAWGFDDVLLRNAAAWTEDTELTFYSEGSLAGSSEIDFINKGAATKVKAERLKAMLNEPIDFLKIDIEGAENSVLFDIADELLNVRNLFFEYHSIPGRPQQLGELLSLVTAAGFRYVINGAHGAPHPFVERVDLGFDLQLNVSCFRG